MLVKTRRCSYCTRTDVGEGKIQLGQAEMCRGYGRRTTVRTRAVHDNLRSHEDGKTSVAG